jgi:hypothetical protein
MSRVSQISFALPRILSFYVELAGVCDIDASSVCSDTLLVP